MKIDPQGLLSDLVRTESISGKEQHVVELVGDLCRSAKLDYEVVGGGVLARLERGSGPRLMLTSHLDTVPAGTGWQTDPFNADWKDGRLVALTAQEGLMRLHDGD